MRSGLVFALSSLALSPALLGQTYEVKGSSMSAPLSPDPLADEWVISGNTITTGGTTVGTIANLFGDQYFITYDFTGAYTSSTGAAGFGQQLQLVNGNYVMANHYMNGLYQIGGSATQPNLSGQWAKGNYIYDISGIDEDGWFYLADRSTNPNSSGNVFLRWKVGSITELDIGWRNNQGNLIPSNADLNATYDPDNEQLAMHWQNGDATWTRMDETSSGSTSHPIDENATVEEHLQNQQAQFNDFISISTLISNKMDLLDSDDDVPTLELILGLLQDGYDDNTTTIYGGNVVQGTRNQNGEYVDLEERLDEMDIEGQLESGVDIEQDEQDMDAIADMVGFDDIGDGFNDIVDSASGPMEFFVHIPNLTHNSPYADTGGDIDLFGGFDEFGIPSLEQWAGYIKIIITLVLLMWYCSHVNGTAVWYTEAEVKSAQTSPITNYGGSLGGVVNYPVKAAHMVFALGALGLVVASLAQAALIDGVNITTTIQNTFTAIGSSSGAAQQIGGDATDYSWIEPMVIFLEMFIPVAFAVTVVTYAWVMRWSVMIITSLQFRMSRAVS